MESTSTAPAHNPTSYFSGEDGFNLGNGVIYSRSGFKGSPRVIARLSGWGPQQQSDVAFIVRACNTHNELVDACEWLISELCEAWDEPPEKAIPARVREALARAKAR